VAEALLGLTCNGVSIGAYAQIILRWINLKKINSMITRDKLGAEYTLVWATVTIFVVNLSFVAYAILTAIELRPGGNVTR
jgi:hypothetical protein